MIDILQQFFSDYFAQNKLYI